MLDSLRWIGCDICAWRFNNIGFCGYQGHLCGADAFRVSIEFDECIRWFLLVSGSLGGADTLWVSTTLNSLYNSGLCHHDGLLESSWLYGIFWNRLYVQYNVLDESHIERG